LAGDSAFDAAPVGPVVVLGIVFGVPFDPPGDVIAELPPELAPEVAAPVVVECTVPEPELVIPDLFVLSVCAAGPVFWAKAPPATPIPIVSAPAIAPIFIIS
jgi:hypothetical protein